MLRAYVASLEKASLVSMRSLGLAARASMCVCRSVRDLRRACASKWHFRRKKARVTESQKLRCMRRLHRFLDASHSRHLLRVKRFAMVALRLPACVVS